MCSLPFSPSLSPIQRKLLLLELMRKYCFYKHLNLAESSAWSFNQQHILLAEQEDPLPAAVQLLCAHGSMAFQSESETAQLTSSAVLLSLSLHPFKKFPLFTLAPHSIVITALNVLFIAYPLAYSCPWKRPWQLETSQQLSLAGASFWSGIWLHN